MTERNKREILLGTGNRGKLSELSELFSGLAIDWRNLNDSSDIVEVEENGTTFTQNAILKAEGYARQTGLYTLADDSGLEVEALGNMPGVLSARYAGENAGDDDKIRKILRELGQADASGRSARFVCVMALADETGKIVFTAEGICPGRIANAPQGTNGFGYDPIFVPDGFDSTFGVLGADIKQQISHRGRAAAEIIRYLRGFYAV